MTAACNGYITLLFQVCLLFPCSCLLNSRCKCITGENNQNMFFWLYAYTEFQLWAVYFRFTQSELWRLENRISLIHLSHVEGNFVNIMWNRK